MFPPCSIERLVKGDVMNRRQFTCNALTGLFANSLLLTGANLLPAACSSTQKRPRKILFRTLTARLGMINEDGSGLTYIEPDIPGQVSWGYGPLFSDGRRVILTSFEEGKGWEGAALSHIWIYDFEAKTLDEIAAKNRPADYHVPCLLLPGEERMVTQPFIGNEQRIYTMNLDGSDQVELTHEGEGFHYGVSLNPDGTRLACHVTRIGPDNPYAIVTLRLDGSNRTRVAGHPDHLFFGTSWSPDGEWILYQDCHFRTDPGHDWSDICIGRPDGSEHKVVTSGQSHWFGTSYGTPETRGGGSNMPEWSPDGSTVTYTRAKPGSKTAWQWATDRPDTDHFNRDYMPDKASGGTDICLLNPFTKAVAHLTENEPLIWDFRTVWSSQGDKMAFCRAKVGRPSELWIMDADGGDRRFLTRGENDMGVDHPRFLI